MDINGLRAIAALYGFPWTDADLEAALPLVNRTVEVLATLDTVPVGPAVEPVTHFRVV